MKYILKDNEYYFNMPTFNLNSKSFELSPPTFQTRRQEIADSLRPWPGNPGRVSGFRHKNLDFRTSSTAQPIPRWMRWIPPRGGPKTRILLKAFKKKRGITRCNYMQYLEVLKIPERFEKFYISSIHLFHTCINSGGLNHLFQKQYWWYRSNRLLTTCFFCGKCDDVVVLL